MTEGNVAGLCSSDVIVLVMGLTGSGRSTFIEKLTDEDAGISHSLISGTTGLKLHCFVSGSNRVFLLDTPGFDSTPSHDTAIFQEIAFFLGQAYRFGATVGGILYLHRITSNRVSGSASRNFALINRMCGRLGAKFTMLVTTMWNTIAFESSDYQQAQERETELKTTKGYWGWMASYGSRTQRWEGTKASAHSILTSLLWISESRGPVIFQIQKELIDEAKALDNTAAGTELVKYHGAAGQEFQRELKALRSSLKREEEGSGKTSTRHFRDQKAIVENRLANVELAERDLRDGFEALSRKKTEPYRKLFEDTQREVSTLSNQIQELQGQLRQLQKQPPKGKVTSKRKPLVQALRSAERQQSQKKQGDKKALVLPKDKSTEPTVRTVEMELARREKRRVMKRNALAILGMLGGAATIAAGAATLQIPVVAAGIALFGTAGMKLDLSRKKKKKKDDDDEWIVDDHDG
ncbi:hypothetical protein FDECE_13201 [Fusarium decemcellulare]|nr:hypothetical protein FDECE_13201 [Fusarium decemcellulare]